MNIVILLVVLILVVFLVGALVKSAGYLVKRSKISWKHSFIFAALLLPGTVILGVLRKILPLDLPIVVNVGISILLEALMASAYLGSRALDQDGNAVGSKRAAAIGATLCAFGLTAGVIAGVAKSILHMP